jgi:hypothetical protein
LNPAIYLDASITNDTDTVANSGNLGGDFVSFGNNLFGNAPNLRKNGRSYTAIEAGQSIRNVVKYAPKDDLTCGMLVRISENAVLSDGFALWVGGNSGSENSGSNPLFSVTFREDTMEVFWEKSRGDNVNIPFDTFNWQPETNYFFTFVRDSVAKTLAFYVDGQLIETKSYPSNPTDGSNAVTSVFKRQDATGTNAGIILSDLFLVSGKITPEQVSDLYNAIEGVPPALM